MTLIRTVVLLSLLAAGCALAGTGLYVATYAPPAGPAQAQAIVVLGGNAGPGGRLTGETKERFEAGLALYRQGAAPRLVLTGGGRPPMAASMAEAARAARVPEEALLVEPASTSTLQNALFTADLAELDKREAIIVVTHRYHLPRARASFRWAGFESVIGVAADPDGGFGQGGPLLWEAVKWPINLLRGGAASAAMAVGMPREAVARFLG